LARASITMFENAKAELGRDAGFVQAGYCFVVSPDMLEGAKKNVAMQRGLGIVNEWSDGPGFRQHLPDINPDGIAGIVYEPHGGYADPVQATEAYVAAFQTLGGEFRVRTPVRRLLREGGRITGIELDNREVKAGVVVNAAGPWARPLAQSADLDLPLRAVREQDTVWQIPAGAQFRKPRSRWASMRRTTGRSGKAASSSGAVSRKTMSTSTRTITKPPPTATSLATCRRASSAAFPRSPA
jgi:glycine/D-amino acid oxidase-like deaminating enzyme